MKKIIFHLVLLLLFRLCFSNTADSADGNGGPSPCCQTVLTYFQTIRAPIDAERISRIDSSLCQRFENIFRTKGTNAINQGLRTLWERKKLTKSYQVCMKKYRFPQFCHRMTFGWAFYISSSTYFLPFLCCLNSFLWKKNYVLEINIPTKNNFSSPPTQTPCYGLN